MMKHTFKNLIILLLVVISFVVANKEKNWTILRTVAKETKNRNTTLSKKLGLQIRMDKVEKQIRLYVTKKMINKLQHIKEGNRVRGDCNRRQTTRKKSKASGNLVVCYWNDKMAQGQKAMTVKHNLEYVLNETKADIMSQI